MHMPVQPAYISTFHLHTQSQHNCNARQLSLQRPTLYMHYKSCMSFRSQEIFTGHQVHDDASSSLVGLCAPSSLVGTQSQHNTRQPTRPR